MKLSDLKGYVVLEWVNPECPYVQKPLQQRQHARAAEGIRRKKVAWLTINSTRAGHSEFKTPQQMATWMKQKGGAPAATLLDRDSKVGRLYGAGTTPHMYIIDPKGPLIYAGAIDDKRSTRWRRRKTRRTTCAPRSARRWPASR